MFRYRNKYNPYGVLRRDIGGGGSTPPSPLLTDLLAYWKLDATAGIRPDSTSNDLELLDNNTVGYTTGIIGNAASFVRANQEYLSSRAIDIGSFNIAANEDFAISFWFRGEATTHTENQILIGKGLFNDPNGGWYINLTRNTGVLQLVFNDNSGTLIATGSTNYNDGNWHHVVINFDRDGNASVYTDGNTTPVITLDISSKSGAIASTRNFIVGAYATLTFFFTGEVDELGFWKGRILTMAEITTLYNSGAGLTYPF